MNSTATRSPGPLALCPARRGAAPVASTGPGRIVGRVALASRAGACPGGPQCRRRRSLHSRAIVAGMTLEQKVGQMTQPDIRSVTPDDVAALLPRLGPQRRRRVAGHEQARQRRPTGSTLSRRLLRASMATDMAVKVPVIWGTDAVHGHNNVYGATLFPHNIGLGAAHDPGADDADRPRDRRAGARDRHHLGVRADAGRGAEPALGPHLRKLLLGPALSPRATREAMVGGLQGQLERRRRRCSATAKHCIGDGGTFHGQNQGETRTTEADLITHPRRRLLRRARRRRADGDGLLLELDRHRDRPAPRARCTATAI